jgi:four helix bundle protein
VATFRSFEDIEAWKRARQLTEEVYRISAAGSLARDYALRNQMRRACISVMSNIAEGFERDGKGEFVQFLSVAKGSVGELRSQLYIAVDQQYLSESEFTSLSDRCSEISRMIAGLIEYLRGSTHRGSKYK